MCDHRWRKCYEQGLIGGAFSTGWECIECGKSVSNDELTPTGLNGIDTGEMKVIGAHGTRVRHEDGKSSSKYQIAHDDGTLTYIDKMSDKEWDEKHDPGRGKR